MRRVVLTIFDRFQSLDLTGPLECFSTANRWLESHDRAPAYETTIAAPTPGPVTASSGLTVLADRAIARLRAVDTLVVVGGEGTRAAATDPALLRAIARLSARARRTTSVCTGAFVLASAGLLEGRRATTHWRWAGALARRFPGVEVQPDRIWVRDGSVFTSAGVTAGIDLALALIEADLGRDVALEVARLLVVYLRRPGGQAQFSEVLAAQHEGPATLSDVVCFIEANVGGDLTVDALARRANMSPRHFARVFSTQVGLPPAKFVSRVRVEAARRRLESAAGVDEVAADCGFGTAESMRRAFHRALGVSPSDYRARFTERRSIP